ncbi:MAG: hypothetical protein ACOYOB_11360 [Myxococcota bacterium]
MTNWNFAKILTVCAMGVALAAPAVVTAQPAGEPAKAADEAKPAKAEKVKVKKEKVKKEKVEKVKAEKPAKAAGKTKGKKVKATPKADEPAK